MIAMIDESINDLKPKQKPAPARKAATPPPPPSAAPAPPAAEKWSRENHPAFKKAPAAPQPPPPPPEEKEDAAAATYAVNDNVMARWVSGDRAFYPARITSITGSSADRLYTVKFKNYDTMETLRARDIRPMASSAQKRKADGTPAGGGASAVPPPPPPPEPSTSEHVPQPPPGGSRYQPPQPPAPAQSTGVVTSVAARINPDAARQQAEAAAQASEGPSGRPKFKKLKTKELEAGKSKWQDFTTKSRVAKVALKKESMFRTPEGVHGRGE